MNQPSTAVVLDMADARARRAAGATRAPRHGAHAHTTARAQDPAQPASLHVRHPRIQCAVRDWRDRVQEVDAAARAYRAAWPSEGGDARAQASANVELLVAEEARDAARALLERSVRLANPGAPDHAVAAYMEHVGKAIGA